MPRERRIDESWHLDKKFAMTIIGAIFINTGSFIWYAAETDATIRQDHMTVTEIMAWKEKQDDEKSKIDSHLSVIDEKLSGQTKSLDHVIEILEKQPVPRR